MRKINITLDSLTKYNITKVVVEGFLDAHTAPDMEKVVKELLQQQQYRIIVDFSALLYISSAGLGVFMSVIGDVKSNDGDIVLMKMPPKIYKVFDLLGFTEIFPIVDDEEAAISRFKHI
ncbi:anti-anti-sigma factor [candidate division KSB3 bacterium]|uniref:Anti-sigma factor antagonist n=1 Tax=candidate division KSB3 bacterium TaxID=2044937 RepID=A0A2G6E922_9BACT|nr:MAG: anti-anti-sigma factor [candidate division KSB3 bacterium]PIE28970.1 MAG: anti-anti-sigma factor [candidate division KSB3 bacterium]